MTTHTGALDVLIPSCNRSHALALCLTALAGQTLPAFRIVVSDQSDGFGPFATPEVLGALAYLRAHGRAVLTLRHLPRAGLAEQRAFLLAQAEAPRCLFLDDDVLVEPDLLERLLAVLDEQRCGFAGSMAHPLARLDAAPGPHPPIEYWTGPVEPERLRPGSAAWEREQLHQSAALFQLQKRLGLRRGLTLRYRVAWVGGCVLFDTAKLRAAGGFEFWRKLPSEHDGELAVAELQVMERDGGCGILPSGAFHLDLPSTLAPRRVDALRAILTPM